MKRLLFVLLMLSVLILPGCYTYNYTVSTITKDGFIVDKNSYPIKASEIDRTWDRLLYCLSNHGYNVDSLDIHKIRPILIFTRYKIEVTGYPEAQVGYFDAQFDIKRLSFDNYIWIWFSPDQSGNAKDWKVVLRHEMLHMALFQLTYNADRWHTREIWKECSYVPSSP